MTHNSNPIRSTWSVRPPPAVLHTRRRKLTFLVSQLTTWPFVSLTLTRLEPGHRFAATSPPGGAGVGAGAEGGCSASMFAFLTRDKSGLKALHKTCQELLGHSVPECLLDGGDARGHGARHAARLSLLQHLKVRHQFVKLVLRRRKKYQNFRQSYRP